MQADHHEYREWVPADIPGVKAALDGRNVLDRHAWRDIPVVSVSNPRA